MVYSYKTVYDSSFRWSREEIDEIRFWSVEEIEKNIGKEIFTPNFEGEFFRLNRTSLPDKTS
jgi:hypothetical protein